MMTILPLLNLLLAFQGVTVFTLHENGENIVFYEDVNMTVPRITIHPYKSENNAGIILKLIYELDNCLSVSIGEEEYLYCQKGTIAVNTRNPDCCILTLYEEPDRTSKITATTTIQQTVRVYGIDNEWLYVKAINDYGEYIYGWIPPEMQCPTPWTSCP